MKIRRSLIKEKWIEAANGYWRAHVGLVNGSIIITIGLVGLITILVGPQALTTAIAVIFCLFIISIGFIVL
ncbi:MAG: hypothetical protein UU87_C0002G0129 [Parcubacteria group bacterium GW2011_GWA2_42_11]|nr:MAG: hypothetical protein UU87_C0002G0129 [Parcubacteria group bacterium GW2011_GWA2_42_11]